MELQQRFDAIMFHEFGIHANTPLLLAISGGLDSVVLNHLLNGYNITLAHVNFGLRGKESDRDEDFVRELAKRYDRKIEVLHPDTESFAVEEGLSIQEAARRIRYEWFQKINPSNGKILTAHHADDAVETMIMNFFRGTGIMGLKGIPSMHKNIIRPLIGFKRNELKAYAEANELSWMEDSSNLTDKYTRNYFRNKIIPAIKEVYPSAEDQLYHNLQRFNETAQLYEEAVSRHKKRLMEFRGLEVHIPAAKLLNTKPLTTLVFEVFRNYGFHASQVDELVSLCNSETGRYMQSVTHRVLKNRNWLIISPLNESSATTIHTIEKEDEWMDTQAFSITHKVLEGPVKIDPDPSVALLNYNELKYPLILRKWKAGDYFYPLGMKKKKKVARFLIDQKLSALQKENIYVLESAKRIAWIVGLRIDERFKVVGQMKNVRLKIVSSNS
jgi:tRNA(Ile)-lysidine synthase